MQKIVFILLFSCLYSTAFSQSERKKKGGDFYSEEKVLDSIYGIDMYDKMNPQIGGDSSRSNKKGYAQQGWETDYYTDGTTLHKGYYEDGQLKMYKNYYKSGQVERSFKIIDFKRCSIEIFYPDGEKKVSLVYYDGNILKSSDYYPNGQIEYAIENVKTMELLYRKAFTPNGTPQETFEIVNKKKKIYLLKEFHENGAIKTEGSLKYNPYKLDFIKDGVWKFYDSNGKQTKIEKYAYGERLK